MTGEAASVSGTVRGGGASTVFRCVVHGPGRGAWNMAVDEALMAAARRGETILRFYAWDPPCLSLGRHQAARDRYDRDEIARRGLDVVRRPTGGRAVYHHRELTYSVTAPAGAWGSLRESYARINRGLLRGLAGLGAPAAAARARSRAPGPSTRACFRDPLPGEIVSGRRKLVGSAQRRDRGALLQHGSILLHDDQTVADELRRDGGADQETVRAAALAEVMDELPSRGRLEEALRAGFEEEFGAAVREGAMTSREERTARDLRRRYADPEWTWRR